ncbi:signal transduction histidine kinase chea [hydrocarbon metagenome]|uniref:histidine kinase n=1 Tax=hydrocarbon metagenome TaxID=938273 RepID=A0A0W8G6X2_9ZZZZ
MSVSLSAFSPADLSSEDQTIRSLVEQAMTFKSSALGGAVHAFFKEHADADGVAVLDGDRPAGLIMRNEFYQKLGSLYGRDLFMTRPIRLIMNPAPLIVEVSVDVASIAVIAMNRDPNHLYDMVLVTEEDRYLGVVSIKRFMLELSRGRGRQIELLNEQKEILRLANEAEIVHRQQIEAKNGELRDRNEAVKNLLDNAGQGFLSFGSDLVISEEYSLECVQLFRVQIGGRRFPELVARHLPPETHKTVVEVLGGIFQAAKPLQQKVFLSLLPADLTIHDRAVRAQYKLIRQGDETRMMVVLTDVTEKKRLEREMAEERNNVKMVVRALSRQAEVLAAMAAFREFAAARDIWTAGDAPGASPVENVAEPLAEIFRQVHTFKGDFAQLGLHNTAAALHELENALADLAASQTPPARGRLADVLSGLDAELLLERDVAILTGILGESFFGGSESLRVDKRALLELEARVGSLLTGAAREAVLAELRMLRRHNIKDILAPYGEYLAGLAERLEKAMAPLLVTGDDVFLDREPREGFVKALVHVFRNMIDHGLEDVDDRLAAGKSETGVIACHVQRLGEDAVCLTVSDDGRGIDVARVLAKAVQKGLVTPEAAGSMTPEAVYGLLFRDDFSTRDEVSLLSGRGVGLAAVRAETEGLGGSVQVESTPGRGSRFIFTLPLFPDETACGAGRMAA